MKDNQLDDAQLVSAFSEIVRRIDPAGHYLSNRALEGGVSAQIHSILYQQASGTQREVVVRRNGEAEWKAQGDDIARTEFELHEAISKAGLPVPAALFFDSSSKILPSPFMVMEKIDGDMIIGLDWLPVALKRMADFLLALHALDVKTLALPDKLMQDEDPVKGSLTYIPDTSEFAQLRTVVESWQVSENAQVLLHGDFWPNNVLWKDQQIAGVIDWEDAAIGTPLVDLAGARCEILGMFGSDAMETFTQHYLAESEVNLADLPLWEAYSSFAALAMMGEWGLSEEDEAIRRSRTTQFAQRAVRALLAPK